MSLDPERDAQAARLWEMQAGLCGVCKKPMNLRGPSGKRRGYFIDHHHRSNLIRGAVCPSCNQRVGWFEIRLRKARHGGHRLPVAPADIAAYLAQPPAAALELRWPYG